MDLELLSDKDYANLFKPLHAFNELPFNRLNAALRDIPLQVLAFKSKKYKLGIIGGINGNRFKSPFSAPFGGFSYIKDDVSIQTIEGAADSLIEHCSALGLGGIDITLPPVFYHESFISKVDNVLFRRGFKLQQLDLNYAINVPASTDAYLEQIQYNARKNLNTALTHSFQFRKCSTEEEIITAYEVIKMNRQQRGFPLRMSLEQVLATIAHIKSDVFIATIDDQPAAAAIVFHVTAHIVQVVYWGDIAEYASCRPMNFLPYKIVAHYIDSPIQVIDVGPSTEHSNPNYGLCDFKESIGCAVSSKYTWSYNF